jgi:hypothetical protein
MPNQRVPDKGRHYLPFFFSDFSARFSFNVFSGFFFWSFF